jgi:cytochrome c biogenesis protein CcdA/thiol-disulfide isomerase/thioredoxin
MRRAILLAISVFIFLSPLSLPIRANEPVVEILLFYSDTCPHCRIVKEEVLPVVKEKYGDQLIVHELNISNIDNYALMLGLESIYGVSPEQAGIPEIFMQHVVMIGSRVIRENLDNEIQKSLAEGGFRFPPLDQIPRPTLVTVTPTATKVAEATATAEATPTPTAEVTATAEVTIAATYTAEATATFTPEATTVAVAENKPIHLAYFHQVGCRECDRVELDLKYLQGRYPQLTVHDFDVKEEAALAEWLGQRAGLPEEKRLIAPAVFVGDEGLVDEEVHARNLEDLISRYVASGAEAVWEGGEEARSQASANIVERFRSFGLLTVLAAGFMDGLNPCAFATIVFFISYLAFTGRRGREVPAVGAAFALGVFLTYLGVGMGFLKFLAALPFLDAVSNWVYGLTALLCLVLALGSLYDWWQVRRGKPEEMHLKLPLRLRRLINRVIREGASTQAFVPVAFVTGAVISVIELACTGQVYLPTILFVLDVPDLRAQAGLHLVLYNLMFVLPLIVIFMLTYLGTSSEQLGRFVNRHTSTIKLLTAFVFLLLAFGLTYNLLPLLSSYLSLGG